MMTVNRCGLCRTRVLASAAIAVALAGGSLHVRAVQAQTNARTPEGQGLVLGELYRDARQASPRSEAARALVRATSARVSSAKLPPDPQLQLGFMNYELPGLRPMDPLGMTQLQVMQMVPTAGKLTLSGRIADAQAAAAGERARDVEWEVRIDIAMAFYDLHSVDRGLDVARQTLRILRDVLSTTEAMYRVGEGRQTDVLRAQVEIARMTEDTLRMQAMRAGMEARLNALLDRPADTRTPSPLLPALPDTVPTVETLVALSAEGRPMLRAAEADVAAAAAGVQLARREIWPDLQLGVAYGQREGAMGTERMGSLMVGASVPIFASRRQLRMREETAAMRQMAEADLAAMRAETRALVAEAHADLTRAGRLVVLYRGTIIPQAEAAVASAMAAYRVGSVDFMTLLDARMTVNLYRQQLATLEGEEGKAWAELEMLTGRELFDPFRVAAAGSDAR